MNRTARIGILLASAAIFCYAGIGHVLGRTPDDKAYKSLTVYGEVLQKIQSDYVDEPNMRLVTAGSLHAAETPYQDIQNAGRNVQIAANDVQTGISAGKRISLTLDSVLTNHTVVVPESHPAFRGPAQNVALATNGAVAAASSTGFMG